MAEEVKNVITDTQIEEAVKRIETLNKTRAEVASLKEELSVRDNDLANAEKVYGTGSKEFEIQKGHFDTVSTKIEDAEKKIAELTYKQSELKPVLDALTKNFEDALKVETSKEYHIEVGSDGVKGKKVFKQLLEYLEHNVKFTAKTAANLMVLVRNMEENKGWAQSKDFDGVIILRSASVISLYRFILEDMEGKGFYEARTFLECWANCGQSVADAVRQIQKENNTSRVIGANLNLVEEEFNRSENDIPQEEKELTTQEEVAPEVNE